MSSLPPIGNDKASKLRFQHCAEQGLLKHAISTEHHGQGNQFIDLVIAHQRLGQHCMDSGLLLSLNAHLWGAIFPLINYGSKEQQTHYLSALISGTQIGGHAITEPQAGSNINALELKAIRNNDKLILNGHKRYITNSPIADLLVVYAKLEGKLSAFIIHVDDIGAKFLDSPAVSGCHTATMGDVILDQCTIPLNRQLGKTGAGKMMIQQAMELERAFIFAGFSGVMQQQLVSVIKYSRERQINGTFLGKNQAISHKIAEMKLRLDTVKLWVHECARLKDQNKRITLASAETKLFAAEAFLQSSLDAVHILGASGLTEKNALAQLVNDALASRLFSGSSEIQKNIIAALVGTGDGYR
jgi:alkylation response protein AidB-like acyl-CoA dehydrogenase